METCDKCGKKNVRILREYREGLIGVPDSETIHIVIRCDECMMNGLKALFS